MNHVNPSLPIPRHERNHPWWAWCRAVGSSGRYRLEPPHLLRVSPTHPCQVPARCPPGACNIRPHLSSGAPGGLHGCWSTAKRRGSTASGRWGCPAPSPPSPRYPPSTPLASEAVCVTLSPSSLRQAQVCTLEDKPKARRPFALGRAKGAFGGRTVVNVSEAIGGPLCQIRLPETCAIGEGRCGVRAE